jgi:hypothetical protein
LVEVLSKELNYQPAEPPIKGAESKKGKDDTASEGKKDKKDKKGKGKKRK